VFIHSPAFIIAFIWGNNGVYPEGTTMNMNDAPTPSPNKPIFLHPFSLIHVFPWPKMLSRLAFLFLLLISISLIHLSHQSNENGAAIPRVRLRIGEGAEDGTNPVESNEGDSAVESEGVGFKVG
jgi:hypothetical protein